MVGRGGSTRGVPAALRSAKSRRRDHRKTSRGERKMACFAGASGRFGGGAPQRGRDGRPFPGKAGMAGARRACDEGLRDLTKARMREAARLAAESGGGSRGPSPSPVRARPEEGHAPPDGLKPRHGPQGTRPCRALEGSRVARGEPIPPPLDPGPGVGGDPRAGAGVRRVSRAGASRRRGRGCWPGARRRGPGRGPPPRGRPARSPPPPRACRPRASPG